MEQSRLPAWRLLAVAPLVIALLAAVAVLHSEHSAASGYAKGPRAITHFVGTDFRRTDNISVAPDGLAYVLLNQGSSVSEIEAYDASGAPRWTRSFVGDASYPWLGPASTSGVILFGLHGPHSMSEVTTDGTLRWTTTVKVQADELDPFLAEAPQGNLYAVAIVGHGEPATEASSTHAVEERFDASGTLLWRAAVDLGSHDQILDAEAGPDGSLYVLTQTASRGLSGPPPGDLRRFDGRGHLAWVHPIPRSDPFVGEFPEQLGVAPNGTALVVSERPATGQYGLLAISSRGRTLWGSTMRSTPDDPTEPPVVVAHGDGEFIVAGSTEVALSPRPDASGEFFRTFIADVAQSTGHVRWVTTFSPANLNGLSPESVALAGHAVYVAEASESAFGDVYDGPASGLLVTLRVGSDGRQSW